jgi:hypothetical protein
MLLLRHWPLKPEPFKPENSEIFGGMLENQRIVEAPDGLEGAERYKALAGLLDSARANKVVLFNKENPTDSRGRALPRMD